MKIKWAVLFIGIFIASLATLLFFVNPQNLFEKSAGVDPLHMTDEGRSILVLAINNCSYKSCGENILSAGMFNGWPSKVFQEESQRLPSSEWGGDQPNPENDPFFDILVAMAKASPKGKFPWELITHLNRDHEPLLTGFWPQLKQTYAILKGYYSREKYNREIVIIDKNLINTTQWKSFMNLLLVMKSHHDWNANMKWRLVGLKDQKPTFMAIDATQKIQTKLSNDNTEPNLFVTILTQFHPQSGRLPAQVDSELLIELEAVKR